MVDSDSFIQTPITSGDLVEPSGLSTGGSTQEGWKGWKVHVIGTRQTWQRYAQGTEKALNVSQSIDFMTNFPISFWRSSLPRLRSKIMEVTKSQSFDKAFSKVAEVPYSQFTIIFTYAFHFEKHLYTFHLGSKVLCSLNVPRYLAARC